MIDCCFLALVLAIANIITLAIFAGYTVKLRERQFLLEKRNGSEQKQVKDLQERVNFLEEKLLEKYSKRKVKDMTTGMN